MVNLILFGAPGSGKGTLASRLSVVLPYISHISTGDIFRDNFKNNTPLGQSAKKYMEQGDLVPDDLVIKMIRDRLDRQDAQTNGFILDGFPRTLFQAQSLSEFSQIDIFLLLEVPKDILLRRLLGRFACQKCKQLYNKYTNPPKVDNICDNCGVEIIFEQRSDDKEETVKRRLEIYEENSAPIIDFYKELGVMKKVDSTRTLEFTYEDLQEIIQPIGLLLVN